MTAYTADTAQLQDHTCHFIGALVALLVYPEKEWVYLLCLAVIPVCVFYRRRGALMRRALGMQQKVEV